jgi:hypothetical protein
MIRLRLRRLLRRCRLGRGLLLADQRGLEEGSRLLRPLRPLNPEVLLGMSTFLQLSWD